MSIDANRMERNRGLFWVLGAVALLSVVWLLSSQIGHVQQGMDQLLVTPTATATATAEPVVETVEPTPVPEPTTAPENSLPPVIEDQLVNLYYSISGQGDIVFYMLRALELRSMPGAEWMEAHRTLQYSVAAHRTDLLMNPIPTQDCHQPVVDQALTGWQQTEFQIENAFTAYMRGYLDDAKTSILEANILYREAQADVLSAFDACAIPSGNPSA